MALKDTGDIVKAVGFVAIYSAYLEDDIINLIEEINKFSTILPSNIKKWGLSEQIKQLEKAFKNLFTDAKDYESKEIEIDMIKKLLTAIKNAADMRNEVLHSPLIGGQDDGTIIQRNPRKKSSRKVTSAYVIKLANNIYGLSRGVSGISEFSIKRLANALITKN